MTEDQAEVVAFYKDRNVTWDKFTDEQILEALLITRSVWLKGKLTLKDNDTWEDVISRYTRAVMNSKFADTDTRLQAIKNKVNVIDQRVESLQQLMVGVL